MFDAVTAAHAAKPLTRAPYTLNPTPYVGCRVPYTPYVGCRAHTLHPTCVGCVPTLHTPRCVGWAKK